VPKDERAAEVRRPRYESNGDEQSQQADSTDGAEPARRAVTVADARDHTNHGRGAESYQGPQRKIGVIGQGDLRPRRNYADCVRRLAAGEVGHTWRRAISEATSTASAVKANATGKWTTAGWMFGKAVKEANNSNMFIYPLDFNQISTRRRRRALPTTDTELKLMAAAAIIGESSRPKNG